ncbi:MAG: hypothetical protein GTN81_10475 [Proteobacteria bacterium]|nr:hypothetical protein [Pseudomonadota bacterium]
MLAYVFIVHTLSQATETFCLFALKAPLEYDTLGSDLAVATWIRAGLTILKTLLTAVGKHFSQVTTASRLVW